MKRFAHHRGHDERGVSLVMLLVAVVLITIVFGSVLTFQSTAFRSQTAVKAKRARNYVFDNAIDAAIAQLQTNTTWGVAGTTGTCHATTSTAMLTWSDSVAGTIVASCNVQDGDSGKFSQRRVHLAATVGASNETADVTFYDRGSLASVISVTSRDRSG